jgi:diguanylate cyclase (GGDEF)-like protein
MILSMGPTLRNAYLAVALVSVAVFCVLPAGTWLQTLWAVGIGLGVSCAIVVGIRRFRPGASAAWWLFAVGIASNATGQLVEAVNARIRHVEAFPSSADVFYLGLYPAIAAGLALLIRRRSSSRDWGTLVDSTTITTGLGLLSWVFLIRPAASDPTIGLLGHVVSVAYPVGDVVLLAMLVRLLFGSGRRSSSFGLIAATLLVFLSGDVAWAVINQVGYAPGPVPQRVLAATFLVAYTLFGAAALTPAMREVGERSTTPVPQASPLLLGLLTTASLIAPGILAVQIWRGRITDGVAIVIGSVVLFLLVVTRLAQLLGQVEAQARQLRDLVRVDELTGLPNRRAWSAELPLAIERARRDGRALSVGLLDLDHFKRFNDQYGHPAGDGLLKQASGAWNGCLRAGDQLARYGGEEFIVLLPGVDLASAKHALERLRTVTPQGESFSAGLAAWDGQETSDALIDRADAALYKAKSDGRNRVSVAAAPASQIGRP